MINFFFIGLIICLIYLFLEYYTLSARLKKIPIRILVNGTRGKSTTVRILYQILDRQKYRVYAKTTGNRPEILEPDGYIRLIKRHAPASIAENIPLLRKWIDNKTDAVVLEGMALHPEMQRTLSRFIFHPTHTIITNILSDHQEIILRLHQSGYHPVYIPINRCLATGFRDSNTESGRL
jgi:poly-gamma-glutamate synthase PgsB/CapB